MKLYHYTTLETLRLILRNRTLRFACLESVDDQDEGITLDRGSFKKCVFVSCWTDAESENIALWHMYSSGMTGVRIGVDQTKVRFLDEAGRPIVGGSGNIYNFIAPSTDILPFRPQREPVWVKYSDDPVHFASRLSEGSSLLHVENIYIYKRTSWSFQSEVRYVILGASRNELERRGRSFEEVAHRQIAVIAGYPIDCEYVDLSLQEDFFEEAEFVLGPRSDISSRDDLNSLVVKSVPNFRGKVTESKLHIRRS